MATPPFGKIFEGHVWIVPGNTCVKFEVRSFNHFGAIAFSAQKFGGHVTMATPPFREIFGGHVWIVPRNTCVKFEVRSSDHFGAINI